MDRRRRRLASASLAALLSTAAAPSPGDVEVRLAPCPEQTCVVAELPPRLAAALAASPPSEREWREAFAVRTEDAAASEPPGPTLFGRYALDGTDLVFRPRLPFLPGAVYVAALRPSLLDRLAGKDPAARADASEAAVVELRFRLPTLRRDPPRVTAIHPPSGAVPANLLRAYVHFSAPMRPDLAPRFVKLLDGADREVELPFVEIDGGLWDPGHTRLTLLFHPGRIKRGVAPREALGPPMAEGGRYRLVIEPGWPAATGEVLTTAAEAAWRATAPDRAPVAPERWTLRPPRAGTTEPLQVEVGEPLDHALALRLIAVTRRGVAVAGAAELDERGTRWSFSPVDPWPATRHEVRVHPALEDLAGNNLRGAFDRAAGAREADAVDAVLPFRPRS